MPLSPHPSFSVSRALCPEPHAVGALEGGSSLRRGQPPLRNATSFPQQSVDGDTQPGVGCWPQSWCLFCL